MPTHDNTPGGTLSIAYHGDYTCPIPVITSPRFTPLSGDYSVPFALIRLAVLVIVPFIVVDAAIYQLQMLVSGGNAPITAAVLKMALIALFVAAFLFRGKIRRQRTSSIALLFFGYLVLETLHQHFNLGIDFSDILLSYNAYYLLPLIGVLALSIPLMISDRLLVVISIVCAVVCGALGTAQHITGNPIVRTYSNDGNFKVLVWSSFNHIRVFSLFGEPAACAVFFCFIATLAVAMCARRKNLLFAAPLLALSLYMSWVSGARANIAGTMCAVITAAIMTFSGKRGRTKWLPFLWLAVGVIIGTYAYTRTGGGGLATGSMTDATSFSDRFAIWSNILSMFRSTSALDLFSGYGIVQNTKIDPTGLGGSDNLYLAIILHIGIIGLCLVMWLFWNLWHIVRQAAETRRSYLTVAVAATYSTMLLTGLFKVDLFGTIFILFVISDASSTLGGGGVNRSSLSLEAIADGPAGGLR